MKRQFMPLSATQSKEYGSDQKNTSDIWPANSSQQSNGQGSVPNPPSGSGLLSNWKSAQLQQAGMPGTPKITRNLVDAETVEQPAVQTWGPVTGPATYQANAAQSQSIMTGPVSPFQSGVASQQAFFGGAASPHQSGVASQQALFTGSAVSPFQSGVNPAPQLFNNTQMGQPFSPPSQPLQPFGSPSQTLMNGNPSQTLSQPFGAQSQPLSQPLQPFNAGPMSGVNSHAWQQSAAPVMQNPAALMQAKGRKKKRRVPIWARVVLSIVAVFLVVLGSGFYYYEANFAAPLSNITGQTVKRYHGDDAPSQGRSTNSGDILSGGRMNILLLGSDDDYKTVHINGGVLAQTDIVVTIDPATNTVGMLSIPRDSWVNVPGFGMHKLDQAYLLGGGNANGAALTMATIHQDFGIYIDHYAWVGLTGFTKVINTVGGVDVDVLHPITDDAYPDDTGAGAKDPYAVKRLYISPGPQHLTDLQALEYVRSRHADLVGDFGRSLRQQQVLNQLKYKLNNPDMFSQLPTLAGDLNGYVKTDMQLTDVLKLMNFARSLDQNKIQRVTLGPPYSGDAVVDTDAGAQDVVMLNCAKVQPLLATMFALGNNAKCDTQGSTSTTSSVASTSQPVNAPTANSVQAPVNNPWNNFTQMAQAGAMSMSGDHSDFMGIRSLLDLLFLVVFESPAALI